MRRRPTRTSSSSPRPSPWTRWARRTIIGSGSSGQIVGGGFFLGQGVHNVIIRNLTIRDAYQGVWNDKEHDYDGIQMDGAHHVWIDHNDIRHMADGLIDSRKDTTYLTVSYNKLSNEQGVRHRRYTLDKAADLPALLRTAAGPQSSLGTATTTAAATTLTVAKDGTGQYRTVQAAVDAVPANNTARVVISVEPGTYRETVKVPSNKPHVTIRGTGGSRKDTVIVYDNAAGTKKADGTTYGTNRSTVNGDVDAKSFFLGRNWHPSGSTTVDPQTIVRNSTLSAAIKSTPWSDMGGFSWKDDRFAEYKNTGAGAGAASSDRPQLADAQAAGQSVAAWLGDWTPTAS